MKTASCEHGDNLRSCDFCNLERQARASFALGELAERARIVALLRSWQEASKPQMSKALIIAADRIERGDMCVK